MEPMKTGMVKKEGQIGWTEMSAMPVALPGWKVIVVILYLSGQTGGRRKASETGGWTINRKM